MKKMLSMLLIFIMILSAVIPTNVMGMEKDYLNHWANDTIQLFLDKGYISGYPDGSFKPEGYITRAEFITIVNKVFGHTEMADIKFTDVSVNDWYYQEVQKAYKAGYITGISETHFAPNDNLTREQAATIVSKLMNLEDNLLGVYKFTDNNDISEWARSFVGAAAEAGIIKGYDNNTFMPQNYIKRAEAVVVLNNAISQTQSADLIIDKAGTVVENDTFKNIHITEAVGNGEVILKNVTVTGELIVEGGGQNSVTLDNSTINQLTANKSDGKVRVLLTGDTLVAYTTVLSGIILEQDKLTGQGFEEVEVDENVDKNQTITVKADIGTLTMNAKITVNIKTGVIKNIIIEKIAQDSSINLADEVKVLLITVDAKVSFTGNGTIVSVTINADEVSFEQKPEKMTVKEGIKDPDINSPSIGGGGGGSSNPPSPEKLTLLNVSPTADAENAHLKWDYLNFVFNKDMAEIQTKEGIVLKDENNNIIPIKNVVPGTTEKTSLLIIVDTELQLNTKYSIIVPENTIVSATGEKYDKEISYSFKTAKNVISGTLNTKNSYQDYNVYLTKGSDVIDTTKVVNYKQFFFTNISELGIYDIVVRDLKNTIIFRETVEIDNSSVNEIIVSPILTEIEITKMPTKTVYNIGDTIDITGMIVIGTYSDGSTKIENITTDMITGFDSTKAADSQIITVTVNGKNTTYTIVINVPVTSVTVNPSRLELVENEVVEIEAVISPLNATNKSVTWSSSSTTVAAISSDGILTAKTSGSAIITVITADGNKTATCEVMVKGFDDATEDEKAEAIASLYLYSFDIDDIDGMDRAIEMGKEVLKFSPNNIVINFIMGMDLSNKGLYDEALACLEIVIENDVDNTEYKAGALYLGAVISYYQLDELDKALSYLDEIIDMNLYNDIVKEAIKEKVSIIDSLYYDSDNKADWDRAIELGKEILVIDPNNIPINYMIGRDLNKKEFYLESLQYLENVIANDIDNTFYKAWALYDAAEAYYNLDNIEKAIVYLDDVIEMNATEESVIAATNAKADIKVTRGVLAHYIASNYDFTPINNEEVVGIDDYIYKDDIIELVQAGILGTYADGTFRPYLYVTRAEYAKILVVVEEYLGGDISEFDTPASSVTDIDGHWAKRFMNILVNMGIFVPDELGKVYPDDIVTSIYLPRIN